MAINKALFTSSKDDWETPDWLFALLRREFPFIHDVCASSENTKVPQSYYSIKEDALTKDGSWPLGGWLWMNPPFSKIKLFSAKAAEESYAGRRIVALYPARTDTKWWYENVGTVASEIRFLKGRLQFKGAKTGAPFPSAIAIYDGLLPRIGRVGQRVIWWDVRLEEAMYGGPTGENNENV